MNTFNDFLSNANQSVSGWLFAGIDFLVVMVIFITLAGPFGWESALLTSAFIGLILTMLFVYMGVMAWWMLGIFVGLIVVIILYITWGNKYD